MYLQHFHFSFVLYFLMNKNSFPLSCSLFSGFFSRQFCHDNNVMCAYLLEKRPKGNGKQARLFELDKSIQCNFLGWCEEVCKKCLECDRTYFIEYSTSLLFGRILYSKLGKSIYYGKVEKNL